MAVRKAVVLDVPRDDREPRVLGHLIDDGESPPYGTNPAIDSMLQADRPARFEQYYFGYSNGMTFQTRPDVATTHPREWEDYTRRLRDRKIDAAEFRRLVDGLRG